MILEGFSRKRHSRGALRDITLLGSWTQVPALYAASRLPPLSLFLLKATFDSEEELITTCFSLPRAHLPARLLHGHEAEPSQANTIWKRATRSGCPTAHLVHELFVNTDN